MTNLGSGLSLDEQWDLYIDPQSGDLAFDTEGEELRKDLAFNVGRLLSPFVGDYMDDGRRADIKLKVKKLVQADPRIEEVDSVSVSKPAGAPDELEVRVKATTVEGVQIDDVFVP